MLKSFVSQNINKHMDYFVLFFTKWNMRFDSAQYLIYLITSPLLVSSIQISL